MNWDRYLDLKKQRNRPADHFIPENENEAKQALALGIIGIGEYVEYSLTMEPLVDSVHDPDPEVRKLAVRQIAEKHTPFAIRLLHFMLMDVDEEVRLYAASELERIDNEMQARIYDLEQKLKKNPNATALRTELARIYIDYARQMMVGENLQKFFLKKAVAVLNRNFEMGQKNSENYFYRGWVFEMLGDFKRALRDFKEAIGINPRDPRAYIESAQIYFNLKKFDTVKRIMRIVPVHSEQIEEYHAHLYWKNNGSFN